MKKILHIFFILVTIYSGIVHAVVQEQQPQFDELSILVPSCDKYSELWQPFFGMLFKNWPSLTNTEKKIPIYLIGNKQKYNHDLVTNINIENEISWSDNVITALQQIKTKYVLILLEDYIIHQPVDEQLLAQQFAFLKSNSGGYLQISYPTTLQDFSQEYQDNKIKLFAKHSNNRTSLQAGIWDKEVFKLLLKSDESPWAFENKASVRSEGNPQPFYAVTTQGLSYINLVNNSVLVSDGVEFLAKHGFIVKNFNNLPLNTESKAKRKLFIKKIIAGLYAKAYIPATEYLTEIVSKVNNG